MASFSERLSHAWNAFKNKDPATGESIEPIGTYSTGAVSYINPGRSSHRPSTDQTIALAIYTRIAVDAASVTMQHVRTDYVGGFLEEMPSGLNNILSLEANCDQTGRAFIQDLVMSMLDEGVVAAVPIDTSINPRIGSFDILTMRTGKIIEWRPRSVKLDVYNDQKGVREPLIMSKDKIAIIENPFYDVMNAPNSTLRRLMSKLALLDDVDDELGSDKLNMLIQLPYVVKSQTRKEQANERIKNLESQMTDSRYGIGYIDGTERVIQLNRSLENNLLGEIEYLTRMLYSQLSINAEILEGTAPENVMLNYYKRTVDVILNAIVDEFKRKFLTKTARSQNQTIRFYRDPFALTTSNTIADIADKFTRNEILSPNEVRGIVGFKPSDDPKADELRNRNINMSNEEVQVEETEGGELDVQ